MIYVLAGKIEQWVGKEKRVLVPGDAAFVPVGIVHASFTVGDVPSRMLAIFGPSVDQGFTIVEVGDTAAWKEMRGHKAA